MKNLRTITTALTILFFAVSCKKQSANPTPTPVAASKKLQTMIWAPGYSPTQNFTYDAQGRLTQEDDQYETETYVYTGNTVHITDYSKTSARIVEDINATTDNAGRMTSYTGNISYNINLPYTEQGAFTYDANGYLTQVKLTQNNTVLTYDYTITNGDYTQVIYQQNGAGGYTQTNDYFTDKNNLSGVGLYEVPKNFSYNVGLFGKNSAHLLKHNSLLQKGALVPSWTRDFTYVIDSEGYPQSLNLTGTWTSSATYSFQ
jgi:YD repeat-containing protein